MITRIGGYALNQYINIFRVSIAIMRDINAEIRLVLNPGPAMGKKPKAAD